MDESRLADLENQVDLLKFDSWIYRTAKGKEMTVKHDELPPAVLELVKAVPDLIWEVRRLEALALTLMEEL